MKKLCSSCGHINDYESTVCAKCGRSLDETEKYKMCPKCGKVYPLLKDECPECREFLVVKGTAAAMVFDETVKHDGISAITRLCCIFIPVIGFILAVILSIVKVKSGEMSSEAGRNLCIMSFGCNVVLVFAIWLIIAIVSGNIRELTGLVAHAAERNVL